MLAPRHASIRGGWASGSCGPQRGGSGRRRHPHDPTHIVHGPAVRLSHSMISKELAVSCVAGKKDRRPRLIDELRMTALRLRNWL